MDRKYDILPPEEQIRYASVLKILSRSGIIFLIVGFCLYISGLVPVITPVERIPDLLRLRAKDFSMETGIPTGWNWISNLGKGEVISNLGVIYLSVATFICFLTIFPIFVKKGDFAYVIIIILELGVLILAISGILSPGAH